MVLQNIIGALGAQTDMMRYVNPDEVDDADLAAAIKRGRQHLAEASAALDRLAAGKKIPTIGDGHRVLGQDGKSYPARPDPELPARVRELRAGGLSIRGIADRLGCSIGTVHRVLNM